MSASKPTSSHRTWRIAGLLVLIVIKLVFITAMANRNISDFVYQGF